MIEPSSRMACARVPKLCCEVKSVLPFAALPDASNVAMLASANGPDPTVHLGVLTAALCCIVAAAAGVRAPERAAQEEG